MADIIKLLPDNVANQIAAGEVIQRPSSVVKELLENSIDAKSTEIKLIVKDAGKSLVQVIDNGLGMSATDARMSFERHATSKISSASDLFSLTTKGFRGEALASIASISQVELKTKREEDDLASTIKIEGTKVKSQSVCVAPQGTNFAVRNLFFNIPARRVFLKSDNVELRHIIEEFMRVALAHCDIKFILIHNENRIYTLDKVPLIKRINTLFSPKTKDKFFPIEENTEIVSFKGYVSKPNFAKKRRGEQYLFVNNRFIKSNYLNHAISSAFDGLLPNGSFSSFFIFLHIDPKAIDINIHPTKTEVKFEDERSIYAILRSTIKHSLGQYNIAPSIDFSIDKELERELSNPKNKNITPPTITVNPDFNPFKSDNNFNSKKNNSGDTTSQYSFKNTKNTQWQALYSELENIDTKKAEDTDTLTSEILDDDDDFSKKKWGDTYFQIHKKYIVSNVLSGVIIINQTRAHQRILYDEFYNNIIKDNSSSQQLLFPIEIEMDEAKWAILQYVLHNLESIGYSFLGYFKGICSISGIPVAFSETEAKEMIEKTIYNLEVAEVTISEDKRHILALSYSKAKAIKYGEILNSNQMDDIFNKLFACENPTYTPSGKIIVHIMPIKDLDKNFL